MRVIALFLVIGCIVGCVAESPQADTPPNALSEQDEVLPRSEGGAWTVSSEERRTFDGAALPEFLSSEVGAQAQDCVFIEWCDRPNHPEGTVCRVRSACRNQCFSDALFDECDRDALAVCGRIVSPEIIKC